MMLSTTAIAMCAAAVLVLSIGLWSSNAELASLHRVCFAIPLAVFGALHLFAPEFIEPLVPKVMPFPMVWVYGIGCALIAASLSIATGRVVRWSGFLFGLMMLLFVLILFIPGALRHRGDRMGWTFVCRESSFGGAAWMLASAGAGSWPANTRRVLLGVGRALVIPALLLFGVEQILHPTLLPGVPLTKEVPEWVPARALIDYVTGAALIVTGGSVLLNRNTRVVARWVGAWLLLLVIVIYGPVMILALGRPEMGVQVEGINYFADTLLFAGVILVLSEAAPRAKDLL